MKKNDLPKEKMERLGSVEVRASANRTSGL